MFCPKCGDLLKEERGVFFCERGEMESSQRMAEGLYSRFVSKTENPEEFQFAKAGNRFVGGQWFCPGCGVLMQEEVPGAVRCPQCGRNLRNYLWELIELHPHSRP
jgi:rubrerythrin